MNKVTRAKELVKLINEYDKAYFTLNKSLISDEAYDSLWFKLNDLLSEHDIQRALGKSSMPLGTQTSHLDKVQHLTKVMSLDKLKVDSDAFPKQLTKFIDKYDTLSGWSLQSKLDGLTIVIYSSENSKVFVTRGAGQMGENVTHVFKEIPTAYNPALKLPAGMIVRGEAVISVDNFASILAKFAEDKIKVKTSDQMKATMAELSESQREDVISEDVTLIKKVMKSIKKTNKNSYDVLAAYVDALTASFSNARNLASASVRTKSTLTAKNRHVEFVAYDIMNADKFGLFTEHDILRALEQYGFKTVTHKLLQSNNDLIRFFSERDDLNQSIGAENIRDNEEFVIDGLVIKPNSKVVDPLDDGHHAKGQMAIKYAPKSAQTTLLDVVWQEGKNGMLSPVAIYEPVEIGGTINKRAALGSYNIIKTKDLRVGDKIVVKRSNDVTPQVSHVLKDARTGNEIPVELPAGARLDGKIAYNTNFVTPVEEQLDKMATSIGVKDVRTSAFKKIVDAGIVTHVADLFDMSAHKDAITNIKGLGVKTADTLLNQIEVIKPDVTFKQVLNGLLINGAGVKAIDNFVKLVPTYAVYKTSEYDIIVSELKSIAGMTQPQLDGLAELYSDSQAATLARIYDQALNDNI